MLEIFLYFSELINIYMITWLFLIAIKSLKTISELNRIYILTTYEGASAGDTLYNLNNISTEIYSSPTLIISIKK